MNPTLPLTLDESLILRILREAGIPPALTAPPLPPDPAPVPAWAAVPARPREGAAGWVATGLGLALLAALVLRPGTPPARNLGAGALPLSPAATATPRPPTATTTWTPQPTATWTPPPTATLAPPTATAEQASLVASPVAPEGAAVRTAATGGASGNTNHPAPRYVAPARADISPGPVATPPGGGLRPALITPQAERFTQSKPYIGGTP